MSDFAEMWADASGPIAALFGESIAYSNATHSATLTARVGSTTWEIDRGGPTLEKWEARDYVFAAAALVLNGVAVLPAKGHKIRETIGGAVNVFEVMSPAGEPEWRYDNPEKTDIRVHTKFVGTE